jgi:hypothetical protein
MGASGGSGETEARDMAGRTDDALRAVLFQRLLERLEAEQKKDPTIRRFDRKPYVFSLSRHGNELTVDQGYKDRLMRVTLRWRHKPNTDDLDAPWKATVSRTMDQARLALLPEGPQGTMDEIIEKIVVTFLRYTEPE